MTLSAPLHRRLPLAQLCDQLEDFCQQRHVNLSLPSLRADNFSMNLMERLAKGRKSGLTFAPEAGTQRLRDVINKNVTQEDLLQSCRTAFAGGYNAVKLYFMLGLPTETDEDVLGIADLAARVMHTWRESASNKNRGVRITVSTSWFVPKPHTAFQWEPQISKEEYERRVALLREAIKTKTVTYNWHDSDTSFLEAVLARGDRRMCKVLETAWRKGSKLDAWEEYFSLDRWLEAFEECGLDPHFYANRSRSLDEKMPWDMISSGVTPATYHPPPGRACLCRGHHPGLPHPLQRLRRQSTGRGEVRCLGWLLFVKEGTAAYISHLDLLRTVQRAFPRTELEIKHSQGFHPHPIISIVLPLPVAQSSDCELLDFEVTQDTDGSGIAEKLNEGLPEGLRVLDCYEAKRPVRELAYLRADMELEYDPGVPEGAAEALMDLFHRPELLIEKRTKRKQLAEVDIAPMIRSIAFAEEKNLLRAAVAVRAQNPGLNPQLLEKAIARYRPDLSPDFVRVRRRELLDEAGEIFR